MATLYRKYRPQTFAETVGQNHIKLTLEYEIKSGQLAHAYLFCGPRAVGKTTLARVFAKSLNCLNRQSDNAEPCNVCTACQEITAGRSFDMIEIDAASHTGVDNVRENIIAGARTAPSSLKYKIFIIDEVHMLSGAAFNALLKIMEEPPEFVLFVLCTTEVHKIPLTIISRCQRFDFKKISVLDVVRKLEFIAKHENIRADKAVFEAIARHSGGHMRDAESTLGQIMVLAESPTNDDQLLNITSEQAELVIPKSHLSQAIKLIDLLSVGDAGNALRLVNMIADDGYDLKTFLNDIIEMLRQLMLVKVNPELLPALGVELGEALTADLVAVIDKVNVAWLVKSLNILMAARLTFKEAIFGQLPLEIAIVEIVERASASNLGILTERAKTVKVDNCEVAQPITGDLAEIFAKWPEFMVAVRQVNHSLSFVLGAARPTALQDGKLRLTFKHKLHKARISEVEIKRMVEATLLEVYGQNLLIDAVLDDGIGVMTEMVDMPANVPAPVMAAPAPSSNPAIDEVLKAFGGKIVG